MLQGIASSRGRSESSRGSVRMPSSPLRLPIAVMIIGAALLGCGDAQQLSPVAPSRPGITAPNAATSSTGFTLTDLGTLGGPSSTALGINLGGQTTGRSDRATGNARAFIWTPPSGPMTALPIPASYTYSESYNINDNGVVVGMETPSAGPHKATKWEPCATGCAGGYTTTELFANSPPYADWSSFAISINNPGQVVGYLTDPVANTSRGYFYDVGGAWSFLQAPPYAAGADLIVPWAINNNGHIAGHTRSKTTGSPVDPVVWLSPSAPPQVLPTYAACSGCNAWDPQAISDNDWVVGYVSGSKGVRHGVLWTPASRDVNGLPTSWTVTDLGGFGGSATVAYGVNNAGQVVGYSNTTRDKASHAFLWQNGKMQDLGTESGSTNSLANSINNSTPPQVAGQSASHAVIWTLP